MSRSELNRPRGWVTWIPWAGWGLALVLLLPGAWSFVSTEFFSSKILLSDLMKANNEINAVDATDELCARYECVEAFQTELGNFLRFSEEGRAEYWQVVLGDGSRRNGKFLVDITGFELNENQKKTVVDLLFSSRDWY